LIRAKSLSGTCLAAPSDVVFRWATILILRSRPDVVATWSDEEVARRWMMLCPNHRKADGAPMEPTQPEINCIAGCPIKREEIGRRLSDLSWWMRQADRKKCRRGQSQKHNRHEETRVGAIGALGISERSLGVCDGTARDHLSSWR
jgi:hypothetical protein